MAEFLFLYAEAQSAKLNRGAKLGAEKSETQYPIGLQTSNCGYDVNQFSLVEFDNIPHEVQITKRNKNSVSKAIKRLSGN